MAKERDGFEPVVLNELGEVLEYGCMSARTLESATTSWRYGDTLGYHKYCGGRISPKRVSEAHKVLACGGNCGMRIVIPLEVNTIEKLRAHLVQFNP
ncbi:hypothetical protein C4544_02645 [candidate division WS5 bacterium]|uniref:Uncharacterized protein n=1 Tax=candidate division WS5 bacterium TaxID=2093353 RepID=A0A419DE90_9BACT|nr:MAG: hypothetical protein C4544_02645 [candidate division WS5 bacterium]